MALEFALIAAGSWGSFDQASAETDLLRHKYAAMSVTSLPPLSDVSNAGRIRRRWRCRATMTPTQIKRKALLNARTDSADNQLGRGAAASHGLSSRRSRRASWSRHARSPTPEFRVRSSQLPKQRATPPPAAGSLRVHVTRCVNLVHPDSCPALGGVVRRPICTVSLGTASKRVFPQCAMVAAGEMPDQFWAAESSSEIFEVAQSLASSDGELIIHLELPRPHDSNVSIGTATLALSALDWSNAKGIEHEVGLEALAPRGLGQPQMLEQEEEVPENSR